VKVLITGGFGFIGGRLGQYLNLLGYEVLLGSRKRQDSPSWLQQANTAIIDWDNHYSLMEICDGIDAVVHASGMNSHDCSLNPEQAFIVNGVYTERLIKSAIQCGVKKFIYLSTAHVYASTLEGTLSEQSPTTNKHPYAKTNLAGELSVLKIPSNSAIDGFVLRLSNAFGEPVHQKVKCWKLLTNDLCRQAVTTNKLILKSAGTQMRDFVPIKDVSRVIEYLIRNDINDLNKSIINFGSGKSITVQKMAQLIQTCCVDLWGNTPTIKIPENAEYRNFEELEFKMSFLNQINYKFTDNFETELKDLLQFCKINF
jgi:UDP-glucose 4-epimerase